MSSPVIHRPRLAWDGARMVIAAIERGHYAWMADLLSDRLGPEYRGHVEESWLRVSVKPDCVLAEAGLWRVRLDDLLARRADLYARVASVIDETMSYLG